MAKKKVNKDDSINLEDTDSKNLQDTPITTKEELKVILEDVKVKLESGEAPPVYAMSVINHVLNLPAIYEILDQDNKELAKVIWLRIKHSGLQVRTPPMLFSAES